jgi:hypothetical protein
VPSLFGLEHSRMQFSIEKNCLLLLQNARTAWTRYSLMVKVLLSDKFGLRAIKIDNYRFTLAGRMRAPYVYMANARKRRQPCGSR